jgi:energy-coupling factor transporter ATP-binding protein EcfA2
MVSRPEEVFTPATPVQEDMFAARRHEALEDRVDSALAQRGRQVVLYGDTGVGKTSLVLHLARTRKLKMLRVECGPSFDEMMSEAISKVEPVRVTGRKEGGVRRVGGGLGLPGGMVKASSEVTQQNETEFQPLSRTITADMIDTLEKYGIDVLFLDNFENVTGSTHAKQTSRSTSHLLKSLSDRAEDGKNHLKVVVAGIPAASEALIALDDATARRTAQIEVSRMPRDELEQILSRGEQKLGTSFGGLARTLILDYSDGFPYYTHLLALHCCKRMATTGSVEAGLADFDEALDEVIADCDLRLRNGYTRAVETSGVVKVRKSILEAIASYNETEVTFKAIRVAFLQIHPEYKSLERLSFLSTAITPLKDEYQILADLDMPKSRRNLYRFKNPLMRGYIRLRMRKDKVGAPGFWEPGVRSGQ